MKLTVIVYEAILQGRGFCEGRRYANANEGCLSIDLSPQLKLLSAH